MAGKKPIFILIAILGVSLTLLFQNCGTSEYGLYGSRAPQPFDCLDELVCQENPDNLWLESYSSYASFIYRYQDIAGDCNSGGYPANRIWYSLYKVSGGAEQEIVKDKQVVCDEMGRYRIHLDLKTTPSATDSYFVALKIEGIDDQGNVFENISYPNRAEVEVKLSFLSP